MSDDERFRVAVEVVLRHEGGLVDNPADPGGLTNYGLSKRQYPDLDIANLARDGAIAIYHDHWWRRYRYGRISDLTVATKVFDLAVNVGPSTAHKLLQRALRWAGQKHVTIDGIIGPETIAATNAADSDRLLEAIRYLAAKHYWELARNNRTLEQFLAGWLARAYA